MTDAPGSLPDAMRAMNAAELMQASRTAERTEGAAGGWRALVPPLAARALDAGWPLCVSYAMSETASQITLDCPGRADVAPGRVGRPLQG